VAAAFTQHVPRNVTLDRVTAVQAEREFEA
jgi:hypothetical protein